MMVFSGAAQAQLDVTSPGDIIQGVPNDGISQNDNHGWPGNEPPHQAIDDRIDTKYLHFRGELQPTGIRVTPAMGPTLVTGLTFTTANDAVERDPIEYELSGSNESINGPWTLIAEGPIVDFAGATAWPRRTKTTTPIEFKNDIVYKHYQLMFPTVRTPGSANSMQIAEIELLTPIFKASAPDPGNGSVHEDTWVTLSWKPGRHAVSHDVYLGENFADVDAGTAETFQGNQGDTYFVAGFPGFPFPEGLVLGTTYYWRIDEVNDMHPDSPWKGDVWNFTVPPKTAYFPNPADGAKFVNPDKDLSWRPGWGAKMHTVYFGDNFDDVNSAAGGTPQLTTTYDPGSLELEKTYYWRVDEFDAITTHKGDVWRFTTLGTGGGIKGEYFNNANLSGTPALTRIDPEVNFNLSGDQSPGAPIRGDGWSARWTADLEILFTDMHTFSVNCQDGTRLWIDGELIINQWVTPTVTSKYYSLPIYLESGIHSLRLEFFDSGGDAVEQLYWSTPTMAEEIIPAGPLQPPLRAGSPNPFNGATGVKVTPILSWQPGDSAASHEVYFGTDKDAVLNATTASPEYKGSTEPGSESYDPGKLAWLTTYYWRVDEVNNVNPDSPWTGSVWSFTTGDFLTIDDFEAYNDLNVDVEGSNRIFMTWIDGYDTPTNGSQVGYTDPPFCEQTIVHSGRQSMPLFYDNSGPAYYSEATLTLTYPRDWTEEGVGVLTLWFYGDPANTAESMYVAVANAPGPTAVVYHDNPDAALIDDWTQWNINLEEISNQGVVLTDVDSFAIGFGNRNNPQAGGSGMMLIDDIRLYRLATEP